MHVFTNPSWIDQTLLRAQSLDDIPDETIARISDKFRSRISENPVVSVIIAAWNEELNIVRCLDSLSNSETDLPFEVIVVNNNSTDRTQQSLDRLGVRSLFQPEQGVGPSRELGQRNAKGKYVLSADADCIYPPRWIDIMTRTLMKEGNVFVYGRFSYLGDSEHPRWQLFLYEKMRDLMSEIRHVKRPYLNAYGISLGYIRELGLKEGYLDKNMRGFDGRLCFDLMKHGNVAIVRSSAAKAWTGTRAIERDGSFFDAVVKRILREMVRLGDYFSREKAHDTRNSQNRDYSTRKSLETLRQRLNPFAKRKKRS